jgi:hypothetical protein
VTVETVVEDLRVIVRERDGARALLQLDAGCPFVHDAAARPSLVVVLDPTAGPDIAGTLAAPTLGQGCWVRTVTTLR